MVLRLLTLAALLVGVACGSSAAGEHAGDPGAAGAAAGGGTGNAPSAFCPPDPPDDAVDVAQVTGRLVDEAGEPVPDLQATVCGAQCFDGRTDADGHFTVEVGCRLVLGDYSLVPHGRPERAGFYFRLPAQATDGVVVLGDLRLLTLPETGPALVVKTDDAGAPEQTVTSGGVTLEVPEGVRVDLEIDDVFAGEQGKLFRVLPVEANLADEYVPEALGVVATYAVNPFDATFKDAADPTQTAKVRLSFPNDAGLAASTPVEILALGSYLFPEWVTPAAFEGVATGTVTADATRIELDAGEGVEHLTWFAVRPR